MSIYISNIIFHNRAPFEHFEINFNEKNISILNAVNGGGKTTILSHIVDAWYEMVRHGFKNEFEGKAGKYYRVSSSMYSLNNKGCSLFYIRFINERQNFDFIDIRGDCNSDEYDKIVKLENKITYSEIQNELKENMNSKFLKNEQNVIENIFNNNVIMYFPSYRYEEPGYLNDPFKVKTNFSLRTSFSGYLKNPIEVVTGLPELANWIMDVILDLLNNSQIIQTENIPSILFTQINHVFSNALISKSTRKLSVGVSSRNFGATRIQIGERDNPGNWIRTVYPSIFNMSSGESAIITMFCDILKHFDNIKPNGLFHDATGIVLIDEIDKHLHIKLQKDVLPSMFSLFPGIQFIISSHSPFVSMGLYGANSTKQRVKVIDLDKDGIEVMPSSTEVFKEAYDTMISENERFHQLFVDLRSKIKTEKLVLVSEGNNGKHILRAINLLAPELLDKLEFSFSDKTGWQQLKNAYDAMSSSRQAKYLFVFDCDCNDNVRQLQENDNFFAFTFEKRTDDCRAKKGIENLYSIGILTDDFYTNHKEIDDYGANKEIQNINKNAFIEFIEKDTDISHFIHFKPLIEKIKMILQLSKETTSNG